MRRLFLLITALVTVGSVLLPCTAFADGQQVISGNIASSVKIEPPDNLPVGWLYKMGANFDRDGDGDNIVRCFSNVRYNVWVKCDLDENKKFPVMWEYNPNTGEYVKGGKFLPHLMTIRASGGSGWRPVYDFYTRVSGFTDMPPTTRSDGEVTYVEYKQVVTPRSSELKNGNVYRQVLTFKITPAI